MNLSPDVYDSYRFTTVAKAVEESKRWVGCSIICHITIVIICISPPHLPFSATKASANQSAIRSYFIYIRAPNTNPAASDTCCRAAAERRTQIRWSAAALRGRSAAQHGGRCSAACRCCRARGSLAVEVTAVCVAGDTLPDKWGNPCASSFKSGTQRFKCVLTMLSCDELISVALSAMMLLAALLLLLAFASLRLVRC